MAHECVVARGGGGWAGVPSVLFLSPTKLLSIVAKLVYDQSGRGEVRCVCACSRVGASFRGAEVYGAEALTRFSGTRRGSGLPSRKSI